eukprot:PhM_4_TR10347/c0_g1_i2/m.35684
MSFQLHAPSATDRARSHSDPSPTLHPAVVTTSPPPPPHLVPLPPSFSPEQHLIDEHQQHRDITVAQLSLVELAKRLNMPVASLVHSMQRTQRQRSANFGATATIPSNNSSSSSPTQPLLFGSTPPNPLTPPQNVGRHLNGDGSLLPPPSPANVFDAGRQQAASFRRSHSIDDGRHQHHISVSYPSHNTTGSSMWNVLQNETNGLNLVQRSPEIRLSASIEHHTLRWLGGADGEDGGHDDDGDAFLNAMLVPEHTAVIVRERGSNTMRVAVRGSRHYPHHQHREEDSNNDDDRRSRLSASSIQHNDDGEDEIAVGPRPTLTTNSLFSRRKVRFAPEIESIAFIDESEDARNARRSAMRNSRESAGTASGNDAGGGALFPLSNEDEHFLHAPMKSTSFVLKIQLGVPAPLWILFILCCCAFGALPFAVHKLVDATDGSHSAMVISLWQSEVMLFLAVVGMLLLVSIYQFISPKYLFSFTGLWKSAAAGMLFCVTFWTRDYAVANGCAPTLVSAGWGLVPLMQLLLRVLSRAGDDDDDDDDDSYGDYRRHRRRHSNVLLLRFEVYAAVASLVGTVAVVINEQTWYSPTLSPPSLLCGLAPCITV